MNNPMNPLPLFLRALLCGGALLSTVVTTLRAGSATWNLTPTNGDWNSAANWTPATVPNSPSDIATFASSTLTDIFASANTEVSSVVFASGGPSFTITPNPGTSFTISGEGVVNDSGTAQSFV